MRDHHQPTGLTRERLKTPRAAAIAGIIFALVFSATVILVQFAIPEDLSGEGVKVWLQGNTATVSLALTLAPFAGIAFLWFMGVVRDRLGALEDQFFATVFFGSGLLFLAMMFTSAAIAGGLLTSYVLASNALIATGVGTFGRAVMYTITNVYAVRMAGVFMISLATIWVRTRMMPRPFVFLTYGLALVLLVAINLSLWLILIFPAWVFIISLYILIESLRGERWKAEAILGPRDISHPKASTTLDETPDRGDGGRQSN